jgi:holliday junction DNA helicase RuvA
MIMYLSGKVRDVYPGGIVIDINGLGIGVQTGQGLFTVGQQVDLHIHMHWNQEQGPQLFGFRTVQEKLVFTLIVGGHGFGPKLALTALDTFSPQKFINALLQGDREALSAISGVGTKKAETMIVQLKDKACKLASSGMFVQENNNQYKAAEALASLGYSRDEIGRTLSHIYEDGTQEYSLESVLRKALSLLAKKTHIELG